MDVVVRLTWREIGAVTRNANNLEFPLLGANQGLYRLELRSKELNKLYIGETKNLGKRMTNYRRPPSGAQTSERINELLNTHLQSGGEIRLAICTEAVFVVGGSDERKANFQLKRERVLAEHAALVQDAEVQTVKIENL